MLLDDLQWCDPASIKLLELAFDKARDCACFVFALGRGEVVDRQPQSWAERTVERITIGRLSPGDAALLIEDLAPIRGEATVQWVADRADGNPFFIKELTRALRRHGKSQIPDVVLGTASAMRRTAA